MEQVQPRNAQPLEERIAVDPATVTLHGQKYPDHQELPVLSHSSHPGWPRIPLQGPHSPSVCVL